MPGDSWVAESYGLTCCLVPVGHCYGVSGSAWHSVSFSFLLKFDFDIFDSSKWYTCVRVCAWTCACTWHGTGVEGRGQLAGASHLLPPWLLGIKLTLTGLTANTFTWWAVLPALSPLNFKPNPKWMSTGSPRSADCIIILPLFFKVFPSPWQ